MNAVREFASQFDAAVTFCLAVARRAGRGEEGPIRASLIRGAISKVSTASESRACRMFPFPSKVKVEASRKTVRV